MKNPYDELFVCPQDCVLLSLPEAIDRTSRHLPASIGETLTAGDTASQNILIDPADGNAPFACDLLN